MQRKPIANKYRKGTMKSTLHSTYATQLCFGTFALRIQAPKGVKERVKSPYSITLAFMHMLQCIYIYSHTHTRYIYIHTHCS